MPDVTPGFFSISKRSLSTETKAISIPEKKAEKAIVISRKIMVFIILLDAISLYRIFRSSIFFVHIKDTFRLVNGINRHLLV